jgi:hypothetical protein
MRDWSAVDEQDANETGDSVQKAYALTSRWCDRRSLDDLTSGKELVRGIARSPVAYRAATFVPDTPPIDEAEQQEETSEEGAMTAEDHAALVPRQRLQRGTFDPDSAKA